MIAWNFFKVVILEHKSIICPGYSAVLHIHAAIEEVSVKVSKFSFIGDKSHCLATDYFLLGYFFNGQRKG